MTLTCAYVVPGRPATWQRTVAHKGRRLTEKAQREVKRAIGMVALSKRPKGWPLDAEYAIHVRGFWPDRRFGDVDRLVSLHMDALEGVLWKSDRQVATEVGCREVDREHPRVTVVVEVLS